MKMAFSTIAEAERETKLVGVPLVMAANNTCGTTDHHHNTTSSSTHVQVPQLHHHPEHQNQHQHHQPQQQFHDQHHRHQHQHHQMPYGMMMQSSSSSSSASFNTAGNLFRSKDAGAYDLGELDQALFLYLDGGQDPSPTNHSMQDHQRQSSGMRPPTLNIFPSEPMHVVDPSTTKGTTGGMGTSTTSGSKRSSEPSMEMANPRNDHPPAAAPHSSGKAVKREGGGRKGATSEQEGPKTPDPKTLRRLAQNREAARKSRLRKKAYVQQLESSRIRLTQLEQELQRARAQGVLFGGGGLVGGDQGLPVGANNLSSDAVVFDMEYARWLEEHHRLMCELRLAVQEHIPENELRLFVDHCLAHFDEMMNLKSMVTKSDVFHLVSGMWKTPAERCFMWMGGFRPSELLKIIMSQMEALTEQQLMGMCGLQQTTHETEEALSQGLEALNQSLSDTIASDALSCPSNMATYMGQMAVALNQLSTLEGFVRQADNLRQQTMHRLQELLSTRQAARCLLTIAEYFHRLRALSSLWLSRPRSHDSSMN